MKVKRADPTDAPQFRALKPGDPFILVGIIQSAAHDKSRNTPHGQIAYLKLDESQWRGLTSLNAVDLTTGVGVIVSPEQTVLLLNGHFQEVRE